MRGCPKGLGEILFNFVVDTMKKPCMRQNAEIAMMLNASADPACHVHHNAETQCTQNGGSRDDVAEVVHRRSSSDRSPVTWCASSFRGTDEQDPGASESCRYTG